MYNRKLKERFFRYCNENGKSESTVMKTRSMFELTDRVETKEGKDICALDRGTLEKAVVSDGIFSGRSFYTMFSILRQYIGWCIVNAVPGATDAVLHVDLPELDSIRAGQVFSDLDLARRLSEVYPPECDQTSKEVYKLFAWFAWARIPLAEAPGITSEQFESKTLSVRTEGRVFYLSPYARDTAEFLSVSGSFRINNRSYDTIPRRRGSLMLNGTRGAPTAASLSRHFANDFTDARKAGRTSSALTYAGIFYSSFYHVIYQNEAGGIDPDDSISVKDAEIGASREGYERWKLAFDTVQ